MPSSGVKKGKRNGLMLDNVIASQPELGPAPPDGGYGWIVLLGAILIKITVPSILVTSGLFICHILGSSTPSLENIQWLWLPTIYFAIWNFTDPWSVTLSSLVSGRCITATGVLLCAFGLVITSLTPPHLWLSYAIAGLFAGIGASLAMNESDYMLQKYFRVHLRRVFTLCHIGQAMGEIAMPLLVSGLLTVYGIHGTLLILAALVLQALISAAQFCPPKYQQNSQNTVQYTLLLGDNTEENEVCHENLTFEAKSEISSPEPINSVNKPLDETLNPQNEDNEVHISFNSFPRPLFSDSDIVARSNDIIFAVDDSNDEEVDLYVRGPPLPSRDYTCSKELRAVFHPFFCFALVLNASTQITTMALWIMFAPYVVSQEHYAGIWDIAVLLSLMGCASMCSTVVSHFIPDHCLRWRKLLLVSSSIIAGGGWYLLSFSSSILCPAMLIRFGTVGVMHSLHLVMKDTVGTSLAARMHTPLHTFTGLLIALAALGFDADFTTCFKFLAWLQWGSTIFWILQPLMGIIHQ